jgi:hypothetical protein
MIGVYPQGRIVVLNGPVVHPYSKIWFNTLEPRVRRTKGSTNLRFALRSGSNNVTLTKFRNEDVMPILTDEEADALDDLLTKTTPKLNPRVQGPFIRRREMVRS